jgi:hypothetical protein
LVGVGQPDQEPATVDAFTGPGQLVDETVAAALGAVGDDEFEIDEAGEVDLQLGVTPAELLS